MGALQVESKIETAYLTLLNTGYIQTNSTPRRKWGDNSQAKATPAVIVHCGTANNHLGFNDIFECSLDIACVTNSVDDGSRSVLKSIYECARGVIKDNSASSVTAATGGGLTVSGIIFADGAEDISEDGHLQQMTASATIYCTTRT